MATTVNVTVLATDQNNDPVDGATVTAKLSHADVDSTYGYILPEEVSGTTNASGQVVLALWPNELGSTESYYVFKISNPDTGKVQRINATIPNANCNLHAVAESPTYSPGQVTTAPLNANLASIASLTTAADKVLYFSGANTAALANFTAAGRALVDDADAAAQRVTLGLGNVNNTSDADKQISTATQAALDAKQPLDAELTAIAGLTSAADRIPYFTGLGAAAVAVFTSAARTFTAAVDAAAQRVAIGLGNVDDTSDADKPVSTAQAAADAAVLSSAQSYADGLVVGLIDDRGNYDASVNTFPTSGGSGSAGAIKKGDLWTVSVAGTLGGHAVTAGDVIRALVDTPGQTDSNWAITENNFGYVAENSANKNASGGYVGLTLFKINFRNALNTITSFFTNANTAQRTYTFQDRDGTIADLEQFAASTGSSLVGHIAAGADAEATTVQEVLRRTYSVFDRMTSAEKADVQARTKAVDVTAAIVAAEAACAAGDELVWPAGTYKFTEALTISRNRPRWRADGHVELVYAGADTTIDLLTIGDGVTAIENPVIQGGIYLQSDTTMTAGTALRLRRTVWGKIDVVLQGQDKYQTDGNNLWNGVWFNHIDNISFYGQEVFAQNDGIMVNGGVGGAGYKADLYLNCNKVAHCAVGLRVGGAFGGLYTNHCNIIANDENVVVDQTLSAEANREIFVIGGAIDSANVGAGVHLNDSGNVLMEITGGWIASSATHGIHVDVFGGKIYTDGTRIFNNAGDGIRNDTDTPYVNINGGMIHDNGGYGINPTVASHKTSWGGVQMFSNTSGDINTTHASVVNARYGNATGPKFISDRFEVDSNFYQILSSGNPLYNADSNDYFTYDRTNNEWQWYIGSTLVQKIRSNGNMSIGGVGGGDTRVNIQGSATGATTVYGHRVRPQIQSDVTTTYHNNYSAPTTAAASFTLGSLNHYTAEQGSIGSGSSITSQIGFRASSNLTGATNNYGFYGDIASSTGRWNAYMAGSARNYFNGNTCFGTTTDAGKITSSAEIAIADGMTAPSATAGFAKIYVDTSDGDLKVIFGDGTVKTIVTDT